MPAALSQRHTPQTKQMKDMTDRHHAQMLTELNQSPPLGSDRILPPAIMQPASYRQSHTYLCALSAGTNTTVIGASRKSQQHVRWRLLPYLGGRFGIDALSHDVPSDSNCTACYTDNVTAAELTWLRSSEPADQVKNRSGLEKREGIKERLYQSMCCT